MKRIFSLFCAVTLLAALLTGCTEEQPGNVSTRSDGTVNGTNGPDSGLTEMMTENTGSTASTAAPTTERDLVPEPSDSIGSPTEQTGAVDDPTEQTNESSSGLFDDSDAGEAIERASRNAARALGRIF